MANAVFDIWARALKYLALSLVLCVPVHASEVSPLTAVAKQAERSDPLLRREFASVVLLQLAEVYLGEAGIARRQAGTADSLLLDWVFRVEKEAERYLLLHDAVQQGNPVRIAVLNSCKGCLMISVAGQSILVSHPRPSQHAALEAAIIEDFCRRVECVSIFADSKQVPRLATPD